MPIRTKEYMQDVRNDIVHALARCISRKGVADTAIADLVKESGLSTGAIYRHFKNKDEIVVALVKDRLHAFDEESLLKELGSFDFWGYIDWSLKRVTTTEHVYLADLEFLSLARVNPKIRAVYQTSERVWTSVLEKCVATLPGADALARHPEIQRALLDSIRAIGNQIIMQRMIGSKADATAARRQIEMSVEGAFALAAKTRGAAKASGKPRAEAVSG